VEARNLLRIHLEKRILDQYMRSMTDEMERGFERACKRMERFFLKPVQQIGSCCFDDAQDGTDENENEVEDEDDNANLLPDVSKPLRMRATGGVDTTSEKSVARFISNTSYITHNMHPSLSVDLRRIAMTHLKCIKQAHCHLLNKHIPEDTNKRENDKSTALHALVLKIRHIVDEDFHRNHHSSNREDVDCFRSTQLLEFAGWNPLSVVSS